MLDGLVDLRPPGSRESPPRTRRKRIHQALLNLCRYLLDDEQRLKDLASQDLLKEHVDLSRLGVSEEFAQTLQAVYEEFGGQHVGQDLLDCIFDCSCCVMAWEMTCADTCSRAMAGSGGGDKKKKEKESLVQVKQFEMCAEQMKSEGPKIVEKDKLDIDDLLAKSKKADFKSFIKLIRVVTAAAMAKHGAAIQEKGLETRTAYRFNGSGDAIGLGKCAEVLCAGDMKYELDQSGLHKCVWTCPKDRHHGEETQLVFQRGKKRRRLL
eukprot:g4968.t1